MARKTHTAYRDTSSGQFLPSKGCTRRSSGTVSVEQLPARGHAHPKTADTIGRINKQYSKALDRLAKK